jgi:hypothetical protein
MMKLGIALAVVGSIMSAAPASSLGADACPPELEEARAALKAALDSTKLPDTLARAEMPDANAPRQNMPDVKAPRDSIGDFPLPRHNMPDVNAPRTEQAHARIRESERACSKGDMARSAREAHEALAILGK